MGKREYTKGFVTKNHGKWRAEVKWHDDEGYSGRRSASTGVACRPDVVDGEGNLVRRDNTGIRGARRFLAEWRRQLILEEAERAAHPGACTPLWEYARAFVEEKEAMRSARPSTTDGYRGFVRRMSGTRLGRTPLGEVSGRQVCGWERSLLEEGLSPTTVAHMHAFLGQVFRHAARIGDIDRDPTAAVDPPKPERQPINCLDGEGARRLLLIFDRRGYDEFGTACLIALTTGMRQGEVCALHWGDVDLGARTIRVEHALSRSRGTYELASPKTRRSRRTVPIGDCLAGRLAARRDEVRAARERLGLPWSDSLYVVGPAAGDGWTRPDAIGREWRELAAAECIVGTQGAPVTFHGLRHTFATLAIASGMDVEAAAAILGHASPSMTLDVYADALAGSKRAGMDALEAVFGGGAGAGTAPRLP